MTLVFNETRFREMSESPTGPVGRHLAITGVKVESAAKALATQEKLVRSGRYRSAFAWALVNVSGLALKVRNSAPQARLIELGTPAHVIRPRGRVINFVGNISRQLETPGLSLGGLWWTHGADRGWLVPDHPLASVQHPGTRAYRIIGRAVRQVLRR